MPKAIASIGQHIPSKNVREAMFAIVKRCVPSADSPQRRYRPKWQPQLDQWRRIENPPPDPDAPDDPDADSPPVYPVISLPNGPEPLTEAFDIIVLYSEKDFLVSGMCVRAAQRKCLASRAGTPANIMTHTSQADKLARRG